MLSLFQLSQGFFLQPMQSKNTVCITRYVQFLFRFKPPTLAFFGWKSAFRSGQLRGAASPKISVPKLIELSFFRWQVGGKIKATAWVIIYIFTQQFQKWVNMRGKCFTETFGVYNWTAELISACNWYDTITWKIASHTNHTIRAAPFEGVAVIIVLREYLLKPKKVCWVLSNISEKTI